MKHQKVLLSVSLVVCGCVHRSWGSSPVSGCSCWWRPPSSCWPRPSCSAASASAAKATTTRCRPKGTTGGRAGSQLKDAPSFLFLSYFVSSKFCPSLHIFWAEPAPAPGRSGVPSLCMRRGGRPRPSERNKWDWSRTPRRLVPVLGRRDERGTLLHLALCRGSASLSSNHGGPCSCAVDP